MGTAILCIIIVVLIGVLIFHPRGPKVTISADSMREIERQSKTKQPR